MTVHADDVTIIITDQADINKVTEIIMTNENATFAKINIHKSTTLSIRLWDNAKQIKYIQYKLETTVLGIRFSGTITRTTHLR